MEFRRPGLREGRAGGTPAVPGTISDRHHFSLRQGKKQGTSKLSGCTPGTAGVPPACCAVQVLSEFRAWNFDGRVCRKGVRAGRPRSRARSQIGTGFPCSREKRRERENHWAVSPGIAGVSPACLCRAGSEGVSRMEFRWAGRAGRACGRDARGPGHDLRSAPVFPAAGKNAGKEKV